MYDVIIIGAGIAGLSAAINTKWQKKDVNILVIEKQDKCGRKLSASGNGKCNVTNMVWTEECYHSQNISFISNFVNRHSPNEVIEFFNLCGIPLYENNGYYYPLSNQAKQVTFKLLDICNRLDIKIINNTQISDIIEFNNFFSISTENKKYESKSIILATGSNACEKLGGNNSGYILSKKIGLKVTELHPGLTPIYVDDDNISIAKGVRINGIISLHTSNLIKQDKGQIQFNDDNLSGIAMMNLSCYLNMIGKDNHKDSLRIDVLPEFTWDELKDYMIKQCKIHPGETLSCLLEGFLPSVFVKYLMNRIGLDRNIKADMITEKQINKISSNIKKLTFTPVDNDDYKKAQVTLGGVSLDEIDNNTFECIAHKGIYVIGELLDMTGKCGGYNISFALLSAIDAANDIVKKL